MIYVPGWRRLVRSGKAYLSLIQLSVTSRITQSRDLAHRGNQGLDYPRGLVEISTAGKGLYTYQCPPPPHTHTLLPCCPHPTTFIPALFPPHHPHLTTLIPALFPPHHPHLTTLIPALFPPNHPHLTTLIPALFPTHHPHLTTLIPSLLPPHPPHPPPPSPHCQSTTLI